LRTFNIFLYIYEGPILGVGGVGAAGIGANMMMQRTCPSGQCRVSLSYKARILGCDWDKSLSFFLLAIHSHLYDFTHPPPPLAKVVGNWFVM
jgi:hypothetical protein